MEPLLMGYRHMIGNIHHHLNTLQIRNLITLFINPMLKEYLLVLNHDELPYEHVILRMHSLFALLF
jgi:hypothetical protein